MDLSHWEHMSEEELRRKLGLLREMVDSGMLSQWGTEQELAEINMIEAVLEKRYGRR
jgi:hypothetical protein